MFLKISLLLIIAATFVAVNAVDIIDFHTCPETANSCEIKQVRVESCHEFEEHTACKIRRRKPAKISFDFVPKFDADNLDMHLTWVKGEDQELPLASLDRDGCKYTKCPTKNGEQQTYSIDVPIESKFPLSSYLIKWNMKTPNAQGQGCCFTMDIKVVR